MDIDPHLTELAHQFLAAATVGNAEKAIDLARRAGDRASRLLAWEEAARLYELALSALPLDRGPTTGSSWTATRTRRSAAGAGEMVEARVAFLRAAELARRHCDAEGLARAALGYSGQMVWGRAGGDPIVIPLLEEAIAAFDDAICTVRGAVTREARGRSSRRARPGSPRGVGRAGRLGCPADRDPSAVVYALHGLLIGLQARPTWTAAWRSRPSSLNSRRRSATSKASSTPAQPN